MKFEMVDVKSEDSVSGDEIDDSSTTRSSFTSVSQSAVSQTFTLFDSKFISSSIQLETFFREKIIQCKRMFHIMKKSNTQAIQTTIIFYFQ